MALVVSDTGPIRYLIEIGAIETLPHLFASALNPEGVFAARVHSSALHSVREFLEIPPTWLQRRNVTS